MNKILIACFIYLGASDPSFALVGRCLLEVGGKKYLDGQCNIDAMDDGSFSIGTGDKRRSRFFAFVNKSDDNTAEGHWNGISAASHADDKLGVLRQEGACWVNSTAKVCAWRP